MVINMQPSADGRYPHHFSPITCTSGDFGHLNVDRVIETVPGIDWNKIACKGIVRTAPQDFPAFGHLFHKCAAFFVPYYQLMESAEAFFGNMDIDRGENVIMPHIKKFNINYLFGELGAGSEFANAPLSTFVSDILSTTTPFVVPNKKTWDICYIKNNGGDVTKYSFYKLTRRGRLWFGVLKSLGYDKVSPVFAQYSSQRTNIDHDENILNLLAYAKVYCDYFMSPSLYNTSILTTLLRCIKTNKSYTDSFGVSYYDATTGELSTRGLSFILNSILVPHEQSMYTQAWNSPNSPTGILNLKDNSIGNSSLIGPYLDQSSGFVTDQVTSIPEYTRLQNHAGNSLYSFTNFGQKLLNAAADLVKRYGLGGSSAIQRLFANFGIDLDEKKANYVHKLFEGSTDLNSTAIVSNADTVNGADGKSLGALAGYVASSVEYQFNYNSRDYGVIIVVSWKQIQPIKLRGDSPAVLRMKPYDFYTPQFDGNALRPIPFCEIGVDDSINKVPASGGCDNQIYGFVNLYDDYRTQPDIVAGDFINEFAENFLIARDFSVLREATAGPIEPQSNLVQMYSQTNNSDITNPFQLDESVGDRFYNFFNFDIDCVSPLKSGSAAYGIPNGDTPMQVNGVQVN